MSKRLCNSMLLTVLLMFVMASVCLAYKPSKEIPESDIAIGGITLGAQASYVRSIYGEPDNISEVKTGRGSPLTVCFRYGDSFYVYLEQHSGQVVKVESTGNNGLETPAGFAVGMKISDVARYYGNAGRSGEGGKFRAYTANWWKNLAFRANDEGVITSISIYGTD